MSLVDESISSKLKSYTTGVTKRVELTATRALYPLFWSFNFTSTFQSPAIGLFMAPTKRDGSWAFIRCSLFDPENYDQQNIESRN